jgi:uncharacterized protein (TIGR02099 family)
MGKLCRLGKPGKLGERFPGLARFFAHSSLFHPQLPILRRTLYGLLTFAFIVYLCAATVLIGLRYFVLPHVDDYRPRIEALTSAHLHVPLHIGHLAPHWDGLQPGVDITGLTIRDRNGEIALDVPHASVSLSWRSLLTFEPVLSSVVVEHANLLVERDAHGELFVAGIPVPVNNTDDATSATWLMHQQALVLRGGTLRWRDAISHAPDLEWHDLRGVLLNNGHDHRFALQASAQGTVLHGPLDIRAHFRHAFFSTAGKPQNWHGQAYLDTGPVDLPTLGRYVKLPIEAFAGRVDNVAWVHFAHGSITSAHGVADGLDVVLHARQGQPTLNLPFMHFTWQLGVVSNDYRLKLQDFRAELGQPPLADGTPLLRELAFHRFEGRYREASQQRGELIGASGDRTDLSMIAVLMRRLPLPMPLLNALARFDPHGVVENYAITLERAAPGAGRMASANEEPIVHYSLHADLQGIGFAAQPAPLSTVSASSSSSLSSSASALALESAQASLPHHLHLGIPGVENLWGRIDNDETQGTLTLDTKNTAITIPGLFDDPQLTFNQLSGAASWTVAPQRAAGAAYKAFRITIGHLSFTNADAHASLTATYTNPGHGPGALDLHAHFARADINHIARYLPVSIGMGLRHYLGHSLVAGTAKDATIDVHGNLTEFPYEHHPQAGLFHIVAPFAGGRFDPSPVPADAQHTWPALENIDGTFVLNNNKLRVDIAHARYHGFALAGITGRIDDLGNHNDSFVVTGAGNGPLADLLDYVNHSPLGSMANHAGDRIHAQGGAKLALKLTVPRTPNPIIGVTGTLGFAGDQLDMEGNAVPPLSNLVGDVGFTNHSAQFTHLTGRFLGGEVSASGGLRDDGHYAVNVAGRLDADAREVRGLAQPENGHSALAALLAHMHGATPYAVSVQGAPGKMPDVDVRSSLAGLALDLPAPLNKAASAVMPLHFTLLPQTSNVVASAPGLAVQRASLTLGVLNAVYDLRSTEAGAVQVVRGAVGINQPAWLPAQGVTAAADLGTLDVDAWRDVLAQFSAQADDEAVDKTTNTTTTPTTTNAANTTSTANAAGAGAVVSPSQKISPPTSSVPSASSASSLPSPLLMPGGQLAQYLPSRLALHVGALTLLHRRWDNLAVGVTHNSERWWASIDSDQVSGSLSWQPDQEAEDSGAAGTLRAHLTRLIVPAPMRGNDVSPAHESTPVSHMPAIHLTVDQLVVQGHDLGSLQVRAHNFVDDDGAPTWQLDALDLKNPAAHLSATAQWSMRRLALRHRHFLLGASDQGSPPRHTMLDFHLDISDTGALLDRLGQPHIMRSGSGVLSGNVTWRGGPTAIDYPSLRGTLALELHHGQILKVDPGVAKLLGVFSLQSLGRFVTLNFRDVVGKGLPFSKVTGSGKIHHGIVHIDKFTMNTSPAKVNVQGTVDLAQETQTLHVHVVPQLHAGVGVIAVAAVNPLLGLGAFVANMTILPSLGSVFASDYAITGPWANPLVEQLHGNAAKPQPPATAIAH